MYVIESESNLRISNVPAGVRAVGAAVSEPGGKDAINLRVAEQWVTEFGKLAKTNNTMIVPAQLGDVSTLVSTVMGTMGNIY